MGLIDTIKNIFANNKKNPQIIVEDFNKVKGNEAKLEVGLYCDKQPVASKKIIIKINGVEYEKTTNNNGIASININLNAGTYDVLFRFDGDSNYNKATGSCKVNINPILTASDLTMNEADGSKYSCKVTDTNNNPLGNTPVTFTVHGVSYTRTTDANGIASLSINLKQGVYTIISRCVDATTTKTITINKMRKTTRMEGTDINKTVSQSATYQCAVYDEAGRIAVPVKITVNGATYTRTPDSTGLCKLNINLQKGTYTLKAEFEGNSDYKGSSVSNKITVNADPVVNCNNPYTQSPVLTGSGCSGMGQCTGYNCACNSLQQAFYNLTGKQVAESTIASWAGTTTAGTGHAGINTAVAKFNKTYGTNLKIEWKNCSDFGSTTTEQFTNIGKQTCQGKFVFFHLLYRNQYGHYEAFKSYNSSSNTFQILNSLGSKCSSPAYCGYIESRSGATQKSYLNGISQPSVCLIYK